MTFSAPPAMALPRAATARAHVAHAAGALQRADDARAAHAARTAYASRTPRILRAGVVTAATIALLAANGVAGAAGAVAGDWSATLDALWNYDQPSASEARFRAERARHAAGTREALEAATQVARALGLQRRFVDADVALDGVAPALGRAPARVRVRDLLERGRVRNSAGDRAAAVPLFEQALAARADDRLPGAAFYRVDALHMLGIAAPAPAGIEWNRKALAEAEAAPDARTRGWRASLLNNLGWSLHGRGDDAGALAQWQEALALREAQGDAEKTRFARWTVARGLRAVGRLDEAEAIQRDLAAQGERTQSPDGYVYEELAEIALARGDAAGARPLAARAWALLKDDVELAGSEPDRLARLARLAGVAP